MKNDKRLSNTHTHTHTHDPITQLGQKKETELESYLVLFILNSLHSLKERERMHLEGTYRRYHSKQKEEEQRKLL